MLYFIYYIAVNFLYTFTRLYLFISLLGLDGTKFRIHKFASLPLKSSKVIFTYFKNVYITTRGLVFILDSYQLFIVQFCLLNCSVIVVKIDNDYIPLRCLFVIL